MQDWAGTGTHTAFCESRKFSWALNRICETADKGRHEMKLRLFSIVCVVALITTFLLVPAPTQAAQPQAIAGLPVSGTFTDALGGVGTFAGTLSVQRFV